MAHNLVARLTLQDNLSSRLRRVAGGMNDLDRRTRGITGSIRQMSGAINSQVSSMGGMRSGLVGLAAGFASAAGAAKAFNATIGAAAKHQASEVAISAIFNDKGLSDSYLKMVDEMALDSPLLNSSEMLKSSKGLIAMTKNLDDLGATWGIIEKLQVLDPTQGTDGAAFAMKEMFQGDSLSMVERFGLNKKELNRIKKLAIPQQIAEINSLLNGMGVTEEAINKMGQTTLGLWSQIGERTEKFMRSIGDMGNSKIGEVLGDILAKFESMDLDAIAVKIDAGIGGAIQKVIDFSKRAWEMRAPIIAVAKAVGTFVGVVAGIITVVKSFGLVTGAIAFLVSPIGLLALGIIGIASAFKAAYKHSEPFRKAVDGIVGAVKGLFVAFTGGDADVSMDIFKKAGLDSSQIAKVIGFGKSLKGAFDKVGGAFKGFFKILSGDSQGGSDIMRAAGLDLKQINGIYAFSKGVKAAIGNVKSAFKGVSEIFAGNKLGGIATLLESGFSPKQVGMITAFASGLRGAFGKVKDIFDGIGTMISGGGSSDFLSALGFSPEAIVGIFAFVENVKSKVTEFVTYLKTKWAELQPSIAMLLERFMSMKDTAISVFTAMWGYIQPVFGALGNAFRIVADVAVMVFTNIIAPAIDFVISMFQAMWRVVGPLLELTGVAIGAAFEVLKIVWDTILQPFVAFLLGGFKEAFERAKPVVDDISTAFGWFGDKLSGIADWLGTVRDAIAKFKVPDWLSRLGGGGTVKFESNETTDGGSGKSNYHGIDYVPYDGYQARLHKGESVVTAQENRESKQGGSGRGISISGNTFNVRQESDIDAIAEQLYVKINGALEAGA